MFKFFLIFNSVAFIGSQLLRIKLNNGVAITLLDIAVAITVLIWLTQKILHKEKITGFLLKGIVFFITVCILSLLANSWNYLPYQTGIATLYLIRFLIYSGLYFLIKELPAQKRGMIKSYIFLTGIIVLAIGFLQFFFYPALESLYYLGWDEHLYRMFGTFLDPNYFGSFLVLFFLFVLEYKAKDIKKIDLLAIRHGNKILTLLILIILGIVLTYSRSAIIMALTAIIVYFFTKKDYLKILTITILFLAFVFMLSNTYIEGLNPFRIASTKARIESIQNAVTIIKDHPILGVGFNTYRYTQNQYGFRTTGFWQTSHADAGTDNSFLFILATTGVIGLTVYIYLMSQVFKLKKILKGSARQIFITVLVTLTVGSMFNNLLFFTPVMFFIWIYLGLTESK